jgi:hypothetical protein
LNRSKKNVQGDYSGEDKLKIGERHYKIDFTENFSPEIGV